MKPTQRRTIRGMSAILPPFRSDLTVDWDAFARRDAWWAASDPRFDELDDALQALGDGRANGAAISPAARGS